MTKIVWKFDCPCGTPSYYAMWVEPRFANEPDVQLMAEQAMRAHVAAEGNEFDPSKLRVVSVEEHAV